jgi:hypothetical protein
MDRLIEIISSSSNEPVEVQEEAIFALASISKDRMLFMIA